ncbi:hypothetical protein K8S19_09315 [bacterium]|nr:hypothetical protein [bacterium]
MKNDQGSASYDEMFGDIERHEVDEARSVLSPAAYFTDLMLLKEKTNQKSEEDIDKRRPDISAIPLDWENTFDETPYLDIVNEVMASRLEKELKEDPVLKDKDAFDVLKDPNTVYPMASIFDKDYTVLHHILKFHKTDVVELYKKMINAPDPGRVARDYLAINQVVQNLLIDKNSTKSSLQARWGIDSTKEPPEDEPVEVLKDVKTMLNKTGLDFKGLQKLLYQNLSQDELKAGKAGDFFINDVIMQGNPRAEKMEIIYENTCKKIWEKMKNQTADYPVADMLITSPDEEYDGLSEDEIQSLADEFDVCNDEKYDPMELDISQVDTTLTRRAYRIKFHSYRNILDWALKNPVTILSDEQRDDYVAMLEKVYQTKKIMELMDVTTDSSGFSAEVSSIWNSFRDDMETSLVRDNLVEELRRGLTIDEITTLAAEYGLLNNPVLSMTTVAPEGTETDIEKWHAKNITLSELRLRFRLRQLILSLIHATNYTGITLTTQTELDDYMQPIENLFFYSSADYAMACYDLYQKKYNSILVAMGGTAGTMGPYDALPVIDSEFYYLKEDNDVVKLMNDYRLTEYFDKQTLSSNHGAAVQYWTSLKNKLTKMEYSIMFHSRRVVMDFAIGTGYEFSSDQEYSRFSAMLESIYGFEPSNIEMLPLQTNLLLDQKYKNIWVELGVQRNFPSVELPETSVDENELILDTAVEVEAFANEYDLCNQDKYGALYLTNTEIGDLVGSTKTQLRVKFAYRAQILNDSIKKNITISSTAELVVLVGKMETAYGEKHNSDNTLKSAFANIYSPIWNVATAVNDPLSDQILTIDPDENYKGLTVHDIKRVADEYALQDWLLYPLDAYDMMKYYAMDLTKTEMRIKLSCQNIITKYADITGYKISTKETMDYYAGSLENYYSVTFKDPNSFETLENMFNQAYRLVLENLVSPDPLPDPLATAEMAVLDMAEDFCGYDETAINGLLSDYTLTEASPNHSKAYWLDQPLTLTELRIKLHSRKLILEYVENNSLAVPTTEQLDVLSEKLENVYDYGKYGLTTQTDDIPEKFNEKHRRLWMSMGGGYNQHATAVMQEISRDEQYTRLTKTEIRALADEYGFEKDAMDGAISDDLVTQWYEEGITGALLHIRLYSRDMIANLASDSLFGESVHQNLIRYIDEYMELLESSYQNQEESYICINNYRKDIIASIHLDLLNRFILLNKISKWSPEESDLILRTAFQKTLDDELVVKHLAVIRYLQNKLEQPVDVVCAFWADMKDWGEGSKSKPEHLFYQVYDKGHDLSIREEPDKSLANLHIRNRIQGSLGMKAEELNVLTTALNLSADVDLSKLTLLYRYATLAKIYKLDMEELLVLLGVLDQIWAYEAENPIKPYLPMDWQVTTLDCHEILCQTGTVDVASVLWLLQIIVSTMDWLKNMGLSVGQLAALHSKTVILGEEGFLSSKDIKDMIAEVKTQLVSQKVTATQFETSRMDAEFAGKLFEDLQNSANDCLDTNGLMLDVPGEFVLEGIVRAKLEKKIILTPMNFTEMGDETRYEEMLIQLETLQYTGESYEEDIDGDSDPEQLAELMEAGRNFFSDADNRDGFTLTGFNAAECLMIFDAIAEMTAKLKQELKEYVEEIQAILTEMREQQEQALFSVLESYLDLDIARLRLLSQEVYLAQGEKNSHVLHEVATPILNMADDAEIIPDEIKNYLFCLQQFVLLGNKTSLNTNQMELLIVKQNYRAIDPMDGNPNILINDIVTFENFSELVNTFNSKEYSILDFYKDAEQTDALLSRATGWEEMQIKKLFWAHVPDDYNSDPSAPDYDPDYDPAVNVATLSDPPLIGSVKTIKEMKDIIEYCQKIGITDFTMIDNVWPEVYGEHPNIQAANNILLDSLKSKISDKDWELASSELHNAMNKIKRDALMPYLIYKLGYENSRDLYAELLIDVEMGDEAATSRLKEAIACAQLYYHRTLNNLETWEASEAKLNDLKRWWGWMKNYRVWEANRKVFLYPENYIRPELRNSKSPAFKALEEELLQTDITDTAVQTAYTNYLEGYATVSSLIISGGSVFTKGDGTHVVMLGYARTDPIQYFYRIGKVPSNSVDPIAWEPWQEISILINSEKVYPVYAFNRLFVFWLEHRDINDTKFGLGDDENPENQDNETKINYNPVIQYTYYNMNKEWKAPQKLIEVAQVMDKEKGYEKITVDNAKFYVANPSESDEYDTEEYIYIKYQGDEELDLFGRVTSELVYEKSTQTDNDKFTTVAFPSDVLGFEPDNPIQWQAKFDNYLSPPWFSFDMKGGNFLCKTDKTSSDELVIESGTPFTEVAEIDAAFRSLNRNENKYITHVISGDQYYQFNDDKSLRSQENVNAKWGNINILEESSEQFETAFILDEKINIVSTNYQMSYESFANGNDEIYEDAQLKSQYDVPTILGDNYDSIIWENFIGVIVAEKAFVFKGKIYLINETDKQYTGKFVDNNLLNELPFDGVDGALVKDGLLYLAYAGQYCTYQNPGWGSPVNLSLGDLCGTALSTVKAAIQIGTVWYFFDGVNYARSDNSYTAETIAVKWGKNDNLLAGNDITAAFVDGSNGLYVFQGNKYLFYRDVNNRFPDEFQLLSTPDGWMEKGISVTAAIRIPGDQNARIYLFSGNKYYAYLENETGDIAIDGDAATWPRKLEKRWGNLPTSFNDSIQSAFYVGEDLYIYRKKDATQQYICYAYDNNFSFDEQNWPFELRNAKYQIIRLTSNTAQKLSQKLLANGIDGLLALSSQELDELPRFTSDASQGSAVDTIYYNPDNVASVPVSDQLDFLSANGIYYWEIFFHTPYLISQTLNTAQKHDEAQKWYHYVYDPTHKTVSVPFENISVLGTLDEKYGYNESTGKLSLTGIMGVEERDVFITLCEEASITESKKEQAIAAIVELYKRSNIYYFWKFLPFHQDPVAYTFQSQYESYQEDPFDPHAIAALRRIAYRKSIVMAYIDNLMDWGDKLFTQYTRETINEARMLYILAYDLLGARPDYTAEKATMPTQNYYQLYTELYPDNWQATLLALENSPVNNSLPDKMVAIPGLPNDDFVARGYFVIPENDLFIQYWDRVEDRLYKIRQCLNIEGVKQPLPLFQPPIDPMALVQAAAGGGGFAAALADLGAPVPHYRFNVILNKSREFASRVIQLGGSLLSALEKKDVEEMSLLRNTQEGKILDMTLDIKNDQLGNAEQTKLSLEKSLENAKEREVHYLGLIDEGLSNYETAQLIFMTLSKGYSIVAQIMDIVTSIGGYMPQVGSPFAMTYGGEQLGRGLTGMSSSYKTLSSMMEFGNALSSMLGGWYRRSQEWELQGKLASHDINQIEHQIEAADKQVEIARKEINVQEKQIKNNEDIDSFLKSKFTNKQLYQWMISKITGIYFQSYQMALGLAKAAQKSFQFEMGFKASEVDYIKPVYWDGLRKGLLAGEQLQYDLDRMEKAYLEKNKRRFEISKTVSLAALDPLALVKLKQNRVCEFDLTERLFAQDFPGHYCRQIKTISISFPAIVGQYKNLNATLTQLTHRTLIEPDHVDGLPYLITPGEGQSMPLSIRADWRPNQQVALSRGENDSGLFQLNFQDERYLPFEGTGAISTWRLELNGALGVIDYSKIQDVIIKVEYSALQGGGDFATAVKGFLETGVDEGYGLILLKQAYSDAWNQFMLDREQGITFTIDPKYCANLNGNKEISSIYLQYDQPDEPANDLSSVTMTLESNANYVLEHGKTIETPSLTVNADETWTLKPQDGHEDDFAPENIRNIALIVFYETEVSF